MQDIRLRTGAGILLCLAAFISIPGAAAAFIWWLLFTDRLAVVKKARMIIPVAIMIAFFSSVLAWTGGDGISYFFRMMVIVLIGFWLFGDRAGFELGMLADMGMETMHLLVRDFGRIRIAESLKGIRPGWKTLVPAGFILVSGALNRAELNAELMAVRGYRDGGTLCPEFTTPGLDILSFLSALCVLIIALVPVSEFFILYH